MSGTVAMAQGRKEYKDEQLLARLIGAAVLLAIAVIVLPFVLSGAGSKHEYDYAESIPAQPDRPVVEQSYSSRQPLPQVATAEQVEALLPATMSEEIVNPLEPVSVAAEPVVAKAVDSSATATSAVTPVTAEFSREIAAGWNIQVASFIKQNNADQLLSRLQSEGLPSYINQVAGRQRPIFRVFVGPLDNQIDALALKNQVDRNYRVESIMVSRN
ncbi:hypothetical protein AB833_06910 [Chromatiales bacterium (ex Bugula neritina AB1)]|nr:hypothetical protein AB833_06910 [Chromatiales bacterium (ex Bugula neritina AB1)]